MAYKGYSFRVANLAAMWAAVQAGMTNIGWTLHDNISATVKVWKSNGESGLEPYGYVWIDGATSGQMNFKVYQYWDNVAHSGTRLAYQSAQPLLVGATQECAFCGDKDLVFIATNATYNSFMNTSEYLFGHIPGRFFPTITTTTNSISTGSHVSIPVLSSTDFGAGEYVQILGLTEGCDKLLIESTDATHIVVTSLPRNYASGAFIGKPASVFGGCYGSGTNIFQPCSHPNDAALVVSGDTTTHAYTVAGLANMGAITWIGKSIPTPYFVWYNSGGIASIGYIPKNFFYASAWTIWDVAVVNNDGSIPVAALATSGDSTTIANTGASYTAHALIGRHVIITAGLGVGQGRKITENTATVITVDRAWETNPNNTSNYIIADRYFRFTNMLSTGLWEVTDTIVPV